jgi:ABC-type phosphate/phosphonate transport system ATPase subunit
MGQLIVGNRGERGTNRVFELRVNLSDDCSHALQLFEHLARVDSATHHRSDLSGTNVSRVGGR